MKEITYEEWLKNPTPRMMWVWDNNPDNATKRKVIYFSGKSMVYPVISITEDEAEGIRFKHCAEIEIEIEKQRRMTNKELSRWLREKPTREFKCGIQLESVRHDYNYYDSESDKEVNPELVVRENDGEWREPLVEV